MNKTKDVVIAVAGQIESLLQNCIAEGNGYECFECWCENGDVFCELGDEEFVDQCVALMKEVAPIVDNLVLNHLNTEIE